MMWSLTLVDPSLLAQPHDDGAAGGGSVTWYSLHLTQTGSCVKAPCLCSAALSLACLLRTQTKTSPQPPVVSKLLPQLRTLFLSTLVPVQPLLVLAPTAESGPGQGITTHRTLAGARSPSISSWCFCRALTAAAAHWLDRPVARRNTQAVCPNVQESVCPETRSCSCGSQAGPV